MTLATQVLFISSIVYCVVTHTLGPVSEKPPLEVNDEVNITICGMARDMVLSNRKTRNLSFALAI
jgi:hypothetical protein